jgi:hypothetical protein
MRRARFSLEEQVGGLAQEERYELRRAAPAQDDESPWVRDETPRRPLQIRAARVSDARSSNAA